MMMKHYISSEILDLNIIQTILEEKKKLELSEEARANITKSYEYLQEKIKTEKNSIYGINTGFGSLYNQKIASDKLARLQENLVMSHACGVGTVVPKNIIRLMLLLKIQSLSYGNSGVQLETVERLMDFFNNDILPVVYSQGSLGASGDLAPLAHLSLPLIGKGEVFYQGKRQSAAAVLKSFGWKPIKLAAKEGLALLNGTQFMTAYGIHCLIRAYKISYFADLISAVSLDAFNGNMNAFDPLVHIVRPHRGQVKTAKRILEILKDSEIGNQGGKAVQDPYSFRCIPQVHGATKDTLEFVRKTLKTEMNSVTDNPNIFMNEDKIISGGNFHGQPLALALDFLSIAIAELGNISERRVYQLISGTRGLPEFLVNNPGLNSGLMIPQYTAASLVSQNKQYATPASVDSIVSSNGQEDHVSMGANSATKCYKVVENVETVLAIELMNASQALYYREPLKSSPFVESFLKTYRSVVTYIEEDRVLAEDILASLNYLRTMNVDADILFE